MTTTPNKTTTYYVTIPVETSAYLSIELPVGLTDNQVLEQITWQATRHIEYDHKAIRCSALDSLEKSDANINVMTD